jgi:pimeloyl-ACP methyl ester carboxylesterase
MTKSRRRLIMAIVLVPVFIYVAICTTLFFLQTSLIFPVSEVGPSGPLPPGAERLALRTATGERLAGLHVPPAQLAGPGPAPLIIGFGGNAWNADSMASYLHNLYPEADVVTFHYRGYPPSEGSPGAAALGEDALTIFDWAARRFPARPVLAAGFSIGSGVTAHLAANRPLTGAILVAPFDSLAAAAADHYPWLPVRLLLRHNMEAAEDLQGSHVPVAIISGGNDTLMIPARADGLRSAAGNLVYSRVIAGAGHNDIYQREDFRTAMQEAFAALLHR